MIKLLVAEPERSELRIGTRTSRMISQLRKVAPGRMTDGDKGAGL